MSGSWHIYRPGQRWQEPRSNARIQLETADYHRPRLPHPRRQNSHRTVTSLRDRKIPPTASDVLRPNFDPTDSHRPSPEPTQDEELAHVLLRQNRPRRRRQRLQIGDLLPPQPQPLPQRRHPHRSARPKTIVSTAQQPPRRQCPRRLRRPHRHLSRKNRRTTNNADPGDSLWVYGRKGEPCRRCNTPIERCLQGPDARSTYWCPICQPRPVSKGERPPR